MEHSSTEHASTTNATHMSRIAALMYCEGMDWELVDAACVEEEGQGCECWEGPSNQYMRAHATHDPMMMQASCDSDSIALPIHDYPETMALDLLKVGMSSSTTNSISIASNGCLNFGSTQKSLQIPIESAFLSLASRDYATENAGIPLCPCQANLADDHVDANDGCKQAAGCHGGKHNHMQCIANLSNDADAGCGHEKSSEVCAKQGTTNEDDHSNSELPHKDQCQGTPENQSSSEVSYKGGHHKAGRVRHHVGKNSRRKKGRKGTSMHKSKREGHSENELAGEKFNVTKAAREDSMKVLHEPPHGHIFTERERRKKMKCLYDTLQSLLSLSKVDKATILEATISKIQILENEKTLLLSQKAAKCKKYSTDNDDLHSENSSKKEMHLQLLHLNRTNESIHEETSSDQVSGNHSCFDMRDPFGHVELHVSGSLGLFTISLQKVVSSTLHLPNVIMSLLLNNNLEVLNAHISSSHETIHYSLYTKACTGAPSQIERFKHAYGQLLCQFST